METAMLHDSKSRATRTTHWLMLLGLFLTVTTASAVEPTNTMAVVDHSLAEVQSAIGKYYTNALDQFKTGTNTTFSEKAFDWMTVSPVITNSLGETGLRFNFYSCHSVPMLYSVMATTVTSNTTRLQVNPGPLDESYKQFKINQQSFTKHSIKILNGVIGTLDQKQ